MPIDVITSLEQVTPDWLTGVLARSGALTAGAVAGYSVRHGAGNWSANAILRLDYSQGAFGELPQRLFLKMVNTDLDDESFGPSEVTYYTRDYKGAPGVPLIRCYDAAYSDELRRYHVLLDDLSETHVIARSKAPTLEYGLALAEGLAAMHAHWWGADRLAEAGAPIHDPAHIRRFVEIAEPGMEPVLEHAPGLLPHWPDTVRSLFAHHPERLVARAKDPIGFTLVHGDANDANVLAPREADRPIYIIDRQPFNWSLTTWLAVYDLAYAMVLDWDVETRRRLEGPVLRRYHEFLVKFGAADYSWDRLWSDYRLTAAMGVYIAVEYCRGGVDGEIPWYVLQMLERSLTVIDDLDCRARWEGGNG